MPILRDTCSAVFGNRVHTNGSQSRPGRLSHGTINLFVLWAYFGLGADARLPAIRRNLHRKRDQLEGSVEPEKRYYLVYPRVSEAPPPNQDLPQEIAAIYNEASNVLSPSPRSAAALLRLCLQKLCVHFDCPGRDINADIADLVRTGKIRPLVQMAMDTIRISGNESVHPGTLNLSDDKDLAISLFQFINLVAEETISQPRKIEEQFLKMPADKRAAIEIRDAARSEQGAAK